MRILALDIGSKIIGLASAESSVRIARPLDAIFVNGQELEQIAQRIHQEAIDILVAGLPRSNSGNLTKQTQIVLDFMKELKNYLSANALKVPNLYFQDESFTSSIAKERIGQSKKMKQSGRIDSEAATIILQDFLESSDFKEKIHA